MQKTEGSRDIDYGYKKHLNMPYEQAIAAVKEELKREGFGVMTEIDVQAKLKEKIGAEFRKYVILGACNPELAHRALQQEIDIGLLLPCNVIVYEEDGCSAVCFLDPKRMVEATQNEVLKPLAEEASERLNRAFDRLS
jgi:uncharacterized protein (DUF302 family)